MRRRYVIVAVVLVALAVGFFVQRTRETFNADRPSQAPAPDKTSVRRSLPALHPIFQRLPVHLEAVADAGPRAGPTNGGFEGRVVSTLTGNGLPGAQLTFAHNGQISSVSGAPDGSFHFEPHVGGLWLLAATTAPGHLPFAPEWGQSPVLLEARSSEIVRGITVALSPAEEFEGRVVDPKDQPVAEADITVLGGGAGATTLVPLENRFRSNSIGVFRFIAPDDAIVEATHEGFASGRAQVDYSVRLSRKLTVRLRPITEAHFSIEGTVIDQEGSPAEGAVVSATLKDKPAAFPMTTRVDVDGRFKLLDLEGGTWTLAASRRGSAPAFAEVAAGTSGVRLQLLRGGSLAGHVRDKRKGTPVAPFTVMVQGRETRTLSVIDPSGEYRFDDLSAGPAVVSVVAPGHAPSAEVRVTIPDPGAGTARADFELSVGGSLTGFVLERGTDAGIPGALVQVEGTPPSLGVPIRNDTLTDGDGGFTLNALAEMTVGIQASAAGHHARIISVPPIPEGETTGPVTIELTPVKVGEDAGVELAGIGAGLQKNGDVFVVVRVVPNSGAAEVGLGVGDAVTSINEVPVKPMTLMDAVPLLRGPEGTTVRLVVVKAGSPQQTVTLIVPRRVVRG
jgi:hypothetical protein